MNKSNIYLDKPFNELTKEDLRKGIKEKFESIARFAEIANFRVYTLNNALFSPDDIQRDEYLLEVYEKAKTIDNKLLQHEISEDLRFKIRNEITKQYKSVKNFCEKNGEFDNVYISYVVNGRIRKITKKVKKLVAALNFSI